MNLNINQIVRSAVVLVIGLPVSLAILAQVPEKPEKTEADKLKAELTTPCLEFAFTKPDSKGERAAKDAIDEVFEDANYQDVCKWVLS